MGRSRWHLAGDRLREPTESVHAAWQRQLEALGGKGHIAEALQTMANLYNKWCAYYGWEQRHALRTLPPKLDPSHCHGDVLARAARSTGLTFALAHKANPALVMHTPCERHGEGYILAMPRSIEGTPSPVLDPLAAQRGLQLLQADPSEVEDLLLAAGILVKSVNGPSLSLAAFNRHFHDIVYVWRKTGRGVPDLCSCRGYSLHAGCEHAAFGASLTLPRHRPC